MALWHVTMSVDVQKKKFKKKAWDKTSVCIDVDSWE